MFANRFKKFTHWLAILMIVLPFNVLSAIKVEAAVSGTTVYVDGTTGSDITGDGTSGNPFQSIQFAIDDTSTVSGDTISISAGVYDITTVPGITVDKDISLVGQGSSTVITGANKNGSISNGSDVLFNITASDASIKDMKIDLGDDDTDYDVAIFTANSGSINNLTVDNTALLFATYGNATGEQLIHLGGGSGANISNNTFDTASGNSGLYVGDGANSSLTISNNIIAPQISAIGGANDTDGGGTFFNQMAPVTNSTISGNSFTDTGIAVYLGSGSSNTDTVTVSNNTFTSNNGHASGYGALAITSEVDGANTQNITVSGNTFTNSQTQPAITIFDATNPSTANVIGNTITLSGNKFSGNTAGAVSIVAGVSGTVSATQNWWGSTSGPNHATTNPTGTGNSVSDNITFRPWCNSSACVSNDSIAPTASLTYSKDGGTTYTTSSAVKDADTLKIKATFNENIEDVTGAKIAIDNSILPATAMSISNSTEYTFDLDVPVGNVATATVTLSNVFDTSGNAISATPANNMFVVDNSQPSNISTGGVKVDQNSDGNHDSVINTKEARIVWSEADDGSNGSGIDYYLLNVQKYSGSSWIDVAGLTDVKVGNVIEYTINSSQASNILEDGTYKFGIKSVDKAGNLSSYRYSNTGGNSETIIDTTAPTLVNAGEDKETNSEFERTATFDTSVSGTKSIVWEETPGSGNITFGSPISDKTIIKADTDGTYIIKVTITDNTDRTASDTFTLIWDTTKPTPTITSINNLYNSSPVEVTIKFDEIVAGFTKEDLTVSNGVATELTTSDDKTFVAKITPTLEGEVTVTLESDKAQDQAGNLNNASGSILSFDYDKTAPTGTLSINSDKEVTNEKEVTLTIAGTDALSGIDKMKVSQELVTASTVDQSVKGDWIDFATAKTFTLTTNEDGDYSIYMQLKDKAGNISSIISDTIFYSSSFINNDVSNPTVDTVNSTDRIIDQIKDNGLYLEVTDKTTGDANIVIGEYEGTPIDKKPTGISVMGKTFEIKTDNDTVFPIALKFYYTNADLVNAGITDETKIVGIYYYDSTTDTWGLYADTGVVTSNTTIDGIEYQGYVWANLDHLTPLAYGADQTAPEKPTNFQVSIVSESEVKLSWNKVDDADKYTIRYKKNAIGQEFTYVSIDKSYTSTSIINLNGATEYIFEIASVDKYNNYSDYSSQTVTTNSAIVEELIDIGLVEVVQAEEEIAATTTTTADLLDDEGEVKATTDENKDEEKEESRALVTIIILLIALAAGVGGYYGYEYWMLNNQKKTTQKNSKNGKKSGRW